MSDPWESAHAETCYRRGYQQGAQDTVRQFEAGASLAQIRDWVAQLIFWRIRGMRQHLAGRPADRSPPPRHQKRARKRASP